MRWILYISSFLFLFSLSSPAYATSEVIRISDETQTRVCKTAMGYCEVCIPTYTMKPPTRILKCRTEFAKTCDGTQSRIIRTRTTSGGKITKEYQPWGLCR